MKYIFIALFIFFIAASVYAEEVSIDHAYLRKLSKEYDSGTVHLFIKNSSKKKIRVKRVYINDELLKNLPNELAIWQQVIPNPIRSQDISNVMIKLTNPPKKPIKIEVELNNGQRLHGVVQPVSPALRFTFVGFNKELNKLYIYIENSGDEIIPLKKLYLNTKDITDLIATPFSQIEQGQKKCIVVNLIKPLLWGDYVTLKIETPVEPVAETMVRAYRYFPVQSWDRDRRSKDMAFNPHTLLMPYPKDGKQFKLFKKAPSFKAYHLFDDPACTDAKEGVLGTSAGKVIKRRKRCSKDKCHPTAIYMCEYKKPWNYFIYGETADLIMVNPYEIVFHKGNPERDGYFTKLAKIASEPRPLFAIPEAFKKDRVGDFSRFPTPEELRLVVYNEISQGAKGILYFIKHYKKGEGYEKSPELEKEIKGINQELQILKEYLIIGEPFQLAQTNNPDVEAHAILCGDKGIALILINKDYQSHFGSPPHFTYTPKQNLKVTIDLPDWLEVDKIYKVEPELTPMEFHIRDKKITFSIQQFHLAKPIILIAK
ncbi:MAG: hypothetical protein P9M01_03710 [Candidatus Kappaea frigidicola]|nr:hypothetical protein [Candidatus Kappaea frigidicola]